MANWTSGQYANISTLSIVSVLAVLSFAFVSSITPGPNNLMLWSSGLNHGWRATMRHLAGVNLGFTFLLFLIAVGLGEVFERFALVGQVLRWVGGGYLLYLAYRISRSGTIKNPAKAAKPMTFIEAALFQWVNPKAWIMGTTAASTLLDPDRPVWAAALAMTAIFWSVNLPCITAWLFAGTASTRWLGDQGKIRIANRVLGLLLVATVVLIVK